MSDNVLDRYRLMPSPEPDNEDDAGSSYKAFGISAAAKRGGETRLRIHFRNGTVSVMSYAYLMEALCTSHQYLSLIFSSCVITLKGRHLDGLLELIQDEKLRYVKCYHAGHHGDAPVNDEVVITEITREMLHQAMERED